MYNLLKPKGLGRNSSKATVVNMRLASDLPNLRDVPDIELHHHGHAANEPAGCLKSLDNSNPQNWM